METGSEGEGDRNISGQFDGSNKRKPQWRTPFQQEMLEKTYAVDTHPSQTTREKLSKTLQLSDRQLEMWFYRRRLKDNQQPTAKRVAGDDGVTEPFNPSNQEVTVTKLDGGGSRHDSGKMGNGVLKFKAGQLAEAKTFQRGFRSAWFRCKIKDISLKNNMILPEYYDYLPEDFKSIKIYEKPPYGKKSKWKKSQLMVRPEYPKIYKKSEMPAVNSISEVCVIIDGTWKVGDLVDWYEHDCYWSATVIKILSDDKVTVELPEPPVGQGQGEKPYEAFCKDLRPSLDWSPRKGWTLPTAKGQTSCSAQLIFPSQEGMEVGREEGASSSRSLAGPMEESPPSQQVNLDRDSSESITTMRVEESKTNDVDYDILDLNIMHEETLEASIHDLEELANRIKWLRGILDNSQSRSGSWKIA